MIEQIPDSAPVILFCLDNTCFKVATADGELTNISKCVAKDDGYHINGDLVVAPEFFIKGQVALLKELIANCGGHIIHCTFSARFPGLSLFAAVTTLLIVPTLLTLTTCHPFWPT